MLDLQSGEAFKQDITKELMPEHSVLHFRLNWCMTECDKKEIKPSFD